MAVISQRHGGVAELVLDWPDVRNAMGPAEARALRGALLDQAQDDSVSVIVLSANGKAFSAGGDLAEVARLAAEGSDVIETAIYGEFQELFRVLRSVSAPVLTAVDGAAIGFGCDLALAGSMTFVGEGGWLAQGWIHAGLIPATGGIHHVAARGGPQTVWRMLTQERVSGAVAEAWGLAIACTNARATALETGAKLAALPQAPLRAMVELSRIQDWEEHLETARRHQVGFLTAPEFAARAEKLLRPQAAS